MAQSHMFLEERNKVAKEFKQYLAKGRNHRILLDCFWVMQARGDEDTQAAFFRKVGFWDNFENRLTKKQESEITKFWGGGAIFEPREE